MLRLPAAAAAQDVTTNCHTMCVSVSVSCRVECKIHTKKLKHAASLLALAQQHVFGLIHLGGNETAATCVFVVCIVVFEARRGRGRAPEQSTEE